MKETDRGRPAYRTLEGIGTDIDTRRFRRDDGAIARITTIEGKLDDCTQSIVTGSRALGTNYQNTSGKIMFVTVSIAHVVGANSCLNVAYVEAGDTTPDTPVARISTTFVADGEVDTKSMSFMVPPGSYYMVSDEDGVGATSTLVLWTEWTLL